MADMPGKGAMYGLLIERLFMDRWRKGQKTVEFQRTDIELAASALGVPLPKNLGDLIYSFRFRREMPAPIKATAPEGHEWSLELNGASNYRFSLVRQSRVRPNPMLEIIEIPDATPDIVLRHAQTDEQALLAKLRYNRLIDIFLGITSYSLQNHLRTSIKADKGRTQIEIDELYVGVDIDGRQFVVPVQAKTGSDQIGIVQAQQDLRLCQERFPALLCRPVAAQFLNAGGIALFELVLQQDQLRVKQERHYQLVRRGAVSDHPAAR
ncbi:MAG: endonuclease [Rubrivivax sp.]|nr:endonuclease [Rubrivivax sp.]